MDAIVILIMESS